MIKQRLGAALLALAFVMSPGCAAHQQPPAGTYSTAGLKAFNAHQLLTDIQALSNAAINLNALAGAGHLGDQDTRYIRDFALAAADGLQKYADGKGTLAVVGTSFATLQRQLSSEAKLNANIKTGLALVANGVASIPQ